MDTSDPDIIFDENGVCISMYYKPTDEDLDEVVMRVKEYYKFT